jgi:hypothetical protein
MPLRGGRGAHINGLDAAEALIAIAHQRVLDAHFRVRLENRFRNITAGPAAVRQPHA